MGGRLAAGLIFAAALLVGGGCGSSAAETRPDEVPPAAVPRPKLRTVASGLVQPIHVAAPRSEPSNLYVVEKAGRIRVLVRGRLRAEPFLDIRNLVGSDGGEQGLFAVAFHPRYAENRRFYVHYTDRRGDTRVAEYRSDGTRAVEDSRRELLFIDQPFSNHNGGQIAFGPDRRLWIGMGDGGSGGDPFNNAQNLRSLLGKLLRIDVDAASPEPSIVGLGLRNPWRFSFDRRTGALYVGDVGQNSWEEVSFVPRRRVGRVQNFGWDVYEGRAVYERKARNSAGTLVRPIRVYPLSGGHCAVTGGFVYRGAAVPSQRGRYFYGDYCTGRVWSFRAVAGRARGHRLERFTVPQLASFGEDARGELYIVSLGGRIHRLAR